MVYRFALSPHSCVWRNILFSFHCLHLKSYSLELAIPIVWHTRTCILIVVYSEWLCDSLTSLSYQSLRFLKAILSAPPAPVGFLQGLLMVWLPFLQYAHLDFKDSERLSTVGSIAFHAVLNPLLWAFPVTYEVGLSYLSILEMAEWLRGWGDVSQSHCTK